MTEHNPYVPPTAELEESVEGGLREELASRPIGLGGTLAATWTIFTRHAGPLLLASAVIYVPLNILLEYMYAAMEAAPEQGILEAVRVSSLLYGLVGVVATLVAIKVTVDGVEGREVSFRTALGGAVARWVNAIGVNILSGIIIFFLALLLIVPGLIWAIFYVFVVQVVVATEYRGSEALAYSKSLVSGRWWPVCGMALLSGAGIIGLTVVQQIFVLGLELAGVTLPLVSGLLGAVFDTASAICTVFLTVYFMNLHLMYDRELDRLLAEPPEEDGDPAAAG